MKTLSICILLRGRGGGGGGLGELLGKGCEGRTPARLFLYQATRPCSTAADLIHDTRHLC